MKVYTMVEAAKALGLSRNQLAYAHLYGGLEDVTKWNGRRVYTLEDLERCRLWFEAKKKGSGK